MKSQIREKMKAERRAMSREEVAEKSSKAAKVFLASEIYKNSKVIMLYMPLGNETDTSEIIDKAFEDGKRVVLPVTNRETAIITPVFYDRNTVLEKGDFSVNEPKNGENVTKSDIDVVVVPGIAFDKHGARVGFGKGCYDMFLSGIRAVKVGFCYEFQAVDQIPSDAHDVKMDFIITENGIKI